MANPLCFAVTGKPFGYCSREGVVKRDGEWYCKRHDPVAIAEKQRAKDAQQAAQDLQRLKAAAWDEVVAVFELGNQSGEDDRLWVIVGYLRREIEEAQP